MATLHDEVRAALRESPFRPRKRLGQNFLVHEKVIDSLLRLLEISPRDEILEIGPGLGFVTRRLVERAAKVWAVEIDPVLVERLRTGPLGAHAALELIHGDILDVGLEEILPRRKIKLVGNLPYSISTPVLFRLFDLRACFSSLVLMVQKEVADRIAALPGSKAYGSLSVWSQVHGRIAEKVPVSPEAFFPRPKVRSTVLKIELYPEPRVPAADRAALRALVRAAFGQRRKTFGNALAGWLGVARIDVENFLHAADIDPRRRGETLAIEEFLRLAHALSVSDLLTSGNPPQQLIAVTDQ